METVVGTSTSPSALIPPTCLRPFSVAHSLSLPCSIGSSGRRNCSPLIVRAKKANKNSDNKSNEKKKVDTHSFVANPDEATGPFPEAVLLKEKKVQEDGRFMPEFADEEEQELFEFLNLQLESDLQVERKRHYEVVYLIHQDYGEEVESVNSKIQDFLKEKQGKVWRFSDWGMRRLAYKIKKATHAHYILMNFELEAKWINEFKSMLDKDDRVIRHLVIKRDKAITEECPPPPEFHTLRADMDEYEEDDDMDYDEEYDEDENEELEDQDELELQDYYDDEDVEEESLLDDGEDDDDDDVSAGNNQPVHTRTGRKKDVKIEKAVR